MPAADTYVFDKHDIAINDPVSDKLIGMMLVQEKGVPLYEEYEDEYLVAQYASAAATYANVDPTKELPIVQSDFRSGMGQEVFSPSDPLRYYEAINCDLRFAGMAIPGPTATGLPAPSAPSAPSITNGDFETGNTTGWTNDGFDTWDTTYAILLSEFLIVIGVDFCKYKLPFHFIGNFFENRD